MSSRNAVSGSPQKPRRLAYPVLATLCCASHAFAAVPAVVADAQQTIATKLWNPQNIAVAPNGTVYVADTGNNQVLEILTNLPGASTQTKVVTTGFNLTSPQGLAVDATGDLFIGDTPVLGVTGRIIEVLASGGKLTNKSKKIYAGGLLDQPASLAVNSDNTLFIGNSEAGFIGGIYRIAAGGTLPVKVNVTGLPSAFVPSALVVDQQGGLFIADSQSTSGGVFEAPQAGGKAKPVLTGSFTLSVPQGLALDSSGNLFVLSELSTGPTGEHVVVIPNASTAAESAPYILPTSNLETGGGMAIDPAGNLDIAEVGTVNLGVPSKGTGVVTQLNYTNPVYLGAAKVFATGTGVVFNFGFNQSLTFSGFRALTVGDAAGTSDVVESKTGNCVTGQLTAVTADAPYLCYETFSATPQYAGMRVSSVQVKGVGSTILSSTPVYELGNAAAQVAYPLDGSTTQLGLIEPQGVAVSGFDQTVYIADQRAGKVFSIAGMNGSQPTAIVTGAAGSSTALAGPTAVAMNGKGDLYIADFARSQVVVVPTTTGVAPYVLNTAGLLQHPISLALDDLGDLFVGDAGPDGDDATASDPGFVVEVPYKGSAFQVPTPGVLVCFPQSLAVNSITGDLFVGDGGDVSTTIGQVVVVPAIGAAHVLSITTPAVVTNPSGLAFDPAGNLYVLDGTLNTITVVSPTGSTTLLPIADPSDLNAASALATTAGSQSFVVTNLGGGPANSIIRLNGNSTTLAFGNQSAKTASAVQTATITNIGNQTLTLKSNFYAPANPGAFSAASGDTCADGDALTAASPACAFSVEFDPSKVGAATKSITIRSNAYNSGTPVIHLTGVGTAKTKAAADTAGANMQAKKTGRKSFAAAM